MATSTNKILRMVFATGGGTAFSISIPEPRENLTAAEVEAVMDMIIAKNMFTTSAGDLIRKRDIKIIETTTDDLYDPPVA
ncbi:MAG: DUF2922 domain-containing protein [Peptococcaceae bacterium]|nr:DUF2922 domain-containing protein [Peptococcaceae bacterium]